MDLYEYQARNLFRQHGVPVLDGAVATTPEEARSAAQSLLDAGSELVVVKAQVKTGGRGKAGGVKLRGNRRQLFGELRHGGQAQVVHHREDHDLAA